MIEFTKTYIDPTCDTMLKIPNYYNEDVKTEILSPDETFIYNYGSNKHCRCHFNKQFVLVNYDENQNNIHPKIIDKLDDFKPSLLLKSTRDKYFIARKLTEKAVANLISIIWK